MGSMDAGDPLLLARAQFGLNIAFHILFPTITIALAWFLIGFRVKYARTRDPEWLATYRLWVKIFALTFAMGVVSGITMSFQFGTNWPGYMEVVGNIAGPLLGYEVLTAFFLEATFLGIMLFGIDRVPSAVHTFSALMVAVGTTLSAFWILALSSWMHTPAGFEIRDGVVHATDWLAVIFNPSFPYRLSHVLLASGLTAAFFVAGLSAYRILKGDPKQAPRLALKSALTLAAVLTPVQIVVGDLHGLNTFEHQPRKVAAMEGAWETGTGVPLLLFAIPDEASRTNHFEVGLPGLASLILTHDLEGEIRGLNDFDGEPPPVKPVFFGFRIMVGIGVLMLVSAWIGCWQLYRNGALGPWMLRTTVAMTFSGWLATLAGWYVTEVGRQPWLVTGILKTADAVTHVPATRVGLTLALYVVVYAVLLWAYIHTLRVMALKAVDVEEFEAMTANPAATGGDTK